MDPNAQILSTISSKLPQLANHLVLQTRTEHLEGQLPLFGPSLVNYVLRELAFRGIRVLEEVGTLGRRNQKDWGSKELATVGIVGIRVGKTAAWRKVPLEKELFV